VSGMRLLIVGGSDAGISAGLRATELDPGVEATLLVADRYPNYSICGLPFYLSGETPDWRQLAHRTRDDLERAGLSLRLDTRAVGIDVDAHRLAAVTETGRAEHLDYDQLVVATGAVPARPPIDGLDRPGVHLLRTVDDARTVAADLDAAARVVIIGGGYIGVELADAMTHRDLEVTLLEMADEVLTTVDGSLGALVRTELEHHGVTVRTATTVDAIEDDGDQLAVRAGDERIVADLVLVVVGVRPNTELAEAAGAATGAAGAIRTDRHMRTSLPDVYAAGDCIETHHRLLEAPDYLPLGTTAHKQGRIAGAHAVGHDAAFAGILGTQVVKIIDLVVARTGLLHHEAVAAGFDPRSVELTVDDHKRYYPGATDLHVRLTADRTTRRVLGAQLLGHARAEIAKRIDIVATALFHDMAVDGLDQLDLAYTPPLSSPWDPIQMAAHAWCSAARQTPRPRDRAGRSGADVTLGG
jgi:NADPH-dependent 2,4-dienoyl-CoA reductase/sulfur reductase-like enzyme